VGAEEKLDEAGLNELQDRLSRCGTSGTGISQ